MPNMDPRQMRNLMAKMGITSTELDARRVIIECDDKEIIVENPQITIIEAQGTKTFQVSGKINERARSAAVEITDDDIKIVMERSGKSENDARIALEESNGDIAAAILKLGQA